MLYHKTVLTKLFNITKSEKTVAHVVGLKKKLFQIGQNLGIPDGTTICENFAVLNQERVISLEKRLVILAKVRTDLDSVQKDQGKKHCIITEKLAKREADLDLRAAQLDKIRKTLDVRRADLDADLDKTNVWIYQKFEELDKKKNEQSEKEKALFLREKKVDEEERKTAEKRELLEQLQKSYVKPPPQPPKDHNSLHELFMDNIFTLDVMEEPVIAVDGFTYEKRCILEWFRTKRTSPTTGAVLTSTALIPNHSLKSQINQWKEEQARSL